MVCIQGRPSAVCWAVLAVCSVLGLPELLILGADRLVHFSLAELIEVVDRPFYLY